MKISKRHLYKTISWRFIGTLDTLLLSWLLSGDIFLGIKISAFDLITKSVLYYFHEILWYKYGNKNSNLRHLIKTVSWRITGTIDTLIIAFLVTGNPLTGFKIGGAETISKMLLYYLHEKLWYKNKFGIE